MENLELTDPKVEGEDVILKGNLQATTFHLLAKAAPAKPNPNAPSPTPAATASGGTR
jgi:hypothetical protein